jgi:hypothetical protein
MSTPEFRAFMHTMSADVRLGRFVRPLEGQTPEVIILSLAQALADADERGATIARPAHLMGAEVRG